MENLQSDSSKEDPIVMYLIINTTLDMSVGKIAAQAGHAASLVTFAYSDLKDECRHIEDSISYMRVQIHTMNEDNATNRDKLSNLEKEYSNIKQKLSIVKEWRATDYRKVTLAANDKEWDKIKTDYPNDIVVVDNGLTEISSGSETCLGLWPMLKSKRSKTLKRLRALK